MMESVLQKNFSSDDFLISSPNLSFLLFIVLILLLIIGLFCLFKNYHAILKKIEGYKKYLSNSLIKFYLIIKNSILLKEILLFSINLFIKAINKIHFILYSVKKILTKDETFLFIGILLLIIFSRFSISYSGDGFVLVPPEKHFMLVPIGVDFYLATIKPALNIIKGENFYYYTANYGPSFSLLAIPFIYISEYFNSCSLNSFLFCSHILYKWFVAITISGYALFILFIFKKNIRKIFLIFLMAFLLGIPGSLGLERGNLDIFFSLILGFLIVLILKSWRISRSYLLSVLTSSFIGIIAGFVSNSKIFLIPFALIAVIAAKNIKIAFLSLIFTFVGVSYLPNLFGSNSDVFDPFRVAAVFDKSIRFGIEGSININHSFSSFLSIISDCVYNQVCDRGLNNSILNRSSIVLLFLIVFIFPLFPYIKIIYKSIKTTSFISELKNIFQNLYSERKNIKLILILFILFDAAINLLPLIAYDYRLFYSLPIIFFLFKTTRKNSKANYYCLLSMIFLLLKGLWVFTNLDTKGMNFFEARGMNIFVILHFLFLLKSGLENYKNDFLGLIARQGKVL